MSSLLDALGYVGESLDKPGRAVRGLLAGRPGEAAAAIPFSDTLGMTDPANAVSGRGLLEHLGLLESNEEGLDFGDVAGFGTEVALDPLNLIGGSLLGKLGLAKKAALANNARRDAMLAKGAMPEEIASLTKAVEASGQPVRVYHGTPNVFDKYDLARSDYDVYGKGAYFAEDPSVASSYVRGASGFVDGAPNVRANLLDVRNPLDLAVPENDRLWNEAFDRLQDISQTQDVFRRQGYDSAKYLMDPVSGVRSPSWVAWDANQIYSPWIAPAQMATPRLSPLTLSLAGHNLLSRAG